MTPDEVVNTIEVLAEIKVYGLKENEHYLDRYNALNSTILLIQDYQKLKEEIERLRVQLAGCGVAALGYATGKNAIEKGSYGYSASFQDVVDLWDKYQKLRERVSVEKIDNILNSECPKCKGFGYTQKVGNMSKHCSCNTVKAQQIVTYLQQPTEPIER